MVNRDTGDGLRQFLTGVGVLLVVAGSILLLYIGIFVVETIADPTDVGLVNLILSRTEANPSAISGSLGDVNFKFGIDDPIATFLFLIVSVWILGALAGIVKTIIGAGRDLVKSAKDWDKT